MHIYHSAILQWMSPLVSLQLDVDRQAISGGSCNDLSSGSLLVANSLLVVPWLKTVCPKLKTMYESLENDSCG